jgi:two-component system, OmpR family, sensor histidine kinase MtrB
VRLAADDHSAAVTVRDYGVGLAPGESAMVFNRFWRSDPARARTSGGTGLGLAISLEDAHLHGGWLQAWGRPGRGAQFRLTLPRRARTALRHSPLDLAPAPEPVADDFPDEVVPADDVPADDVPADDPADIAADDLPADDARPSDVDATKGAAQ